MHSAPVIRSLEKSDLSEQGPEVDLLRLEIGGDLPWMSN
jgi:hypothetical protein